MTEKTARPPIRKECRAHTFDPDAMDGHVLTLIGQRIYGERSLGRGAWQGQFARRLGMTPGRLRQLISKPDRKIPHHLAVHAIDLHELWELGQIDDGQEPPARTDC